MTKEVQLLLKQSRGRGIKGKEKTGKTLPDGRMSFVSLFSRMPSFIQLQYNQSMKHACCLALQYPIHIRIFTFANVFPYMTLTTNLTLNFAWIHLIMWYHFFQCVWIQYPRFSISGSLYYFHIVNQCKQYIGCTEEKHMKKS